MNDFFIPEALNEAASEVIKRIDSYKAVLPSGVVAQQFITSAIGEVNAIRKDRAPTWQSAVKCVYNCAMVGLIPGAALGHAYFIPRKVKGLLSLNLEIGYKGFLELGYAANFLAGVHPQCVLKGEEFFYKVTENGPSLEHTPGWDDDVTRDTLMAAYVVYQTKLGWHGVKVVSRKEIDRVDTGENVWSSDYKAMVLKTPIRRAAKEWRQTTRLGLAIRLDEQSESGQEQSAPVELAEIKRASSFSDFEREAAEEKTNGTDDDTTAREVAEADELFGKPAGAHA